jgi:hypothetical protein
VQADLAVVVLDPLHLLQRSSTARTVRALVGKSRLVLVVNGAVSSLAAEADIRDRLLQEYRSMAAPGVQVPDPEVVFTCAKEALSAFDTFAEAMSEGLSLSERNAALVRFQRGSQRSGIGALQLKISALAGPAVVSLRRRTSLDLATLAIHDLARTIERDRAANTEARKTGHALRTLAHEAATEAKRLSVISRGIDGGTVEGDVTQSLATTQDNISALLRQRWSWLNLIGKARVDDVGSEMGALIARSYGATLEKQASRV